MAGELIDISVQLSERSVVWPSAPRPELTRRLSLDRGDQVNDSNLFMNVHTGTHIDAPLHHLAGGATAEAAPLDVLIGEAWVLDLSAHDAIDVAALEQAWPEGQVTRLLCRTRNSTLWQEDRREFSPGFCALTEPTAEWLIARGVRLVGVDYLSVQRFGDPPTVHRLLLGAGVMLLEGINLSGAPAGRYELLCLPLRLADAEAAPARAVLRRLG